MLDKIIVIGLIGIVFFVPVVVTDSTTVGFTLPKQLLAQVLLSIVILAWLVKGVKGTVPRGTHLKDGLGLSPKNRTVPILRTPLDMAIIVFLVFVLASFRNTTNSAISLKGWTNIMGYVLLYYMVASNLKKDEHIRWIAGAIVLAGLFVSILGILEYMGFGIFKWEKPVTQQVQMWVTMGNSNAVAQYLIMVIPVALGIMLHSKNFKWMLVWACIISIMGSCLILTFAKGAWLGLAGALLFFVALNARKKVTVMVLVGIVAVLFITGLFVNGRLAQIFKEEEKDATFIGRVVMWQSSIRMLQVHPFLGSGLNNFYLLFPKYQVSKFNEVLPNRRPMQVHNDYIQLAVEVGILGLAAFLWIVVRYMKYGMSIIKSNGDKWLTSGLVCGIIALLIHSLTDFGLQMPAPAMMMWVFMGITVAAGEKGKGTVPGKMDSPRRQGFLWIIYAIFIILVIRYSLMPFMAHLAYQRGNSLIMSGRIESAVKEYEKAVRLDDSLTDGYSTLGSVYAGQGLYAQAIEELKKSIQIDNYNIEARISLAGVHRRLGEYDKSIQELKFVIDVNPNLTLARDLLEMVSKEAKRAP